MKIYQIRLHKALADYIEMQKIELTNPEIARNITNFGVRIADELVFNRQHWLLIDQKIDISHWPKREKSELDKTEIWLKTADFLLINKPFGVVCQSGNGHKLDNLEFWLNENLEEILKKETSGKLNENLENKMENKLKNNFEKVKTEMEKPNSSNSSQNHKNSKLNLTTDFNSILQQKSQLNSPSNSANLPFLPVHRLDKNTQGLILFAHGEALEKLQNEFRGRRVIKKYLAVVDGIVEQNWFVSNWQTRDKNNGIIQKFFWGEESAKKYDQNAKNAVSIITPKVICKEKNQTLIQVQILTGRMHQIRLQCQNLGFPLTGDPIYGGLKDGWKNLENSFFNPKLGDFFASFPFVNLDLFNNSSSSSNNSANSKNATQNSQNSSRNSKNNWQIKNQNNTQNELENLEEIEFWQSNWDNSSIQLKEGKLEKITQNLNPREKHFFAQKEKEKLNLKVRFIDKKSKNAPNFDKNPNNPNNSISKNFQKFPHNNLLTNFQNSQNIELINEIKLEGFYNFFGSNIPQTLNLEEFTKLQTQIFGEQEYCLLANFLGIRINDFYLESSVFDLEKHLEDL